MTPPVYRFARHGRTWRLGLVLLAIWAAILAAVVRLDAAPWLMALLGLLTLPALRDFVTNASSGLRIGGGDLHWHSGRRSGQLPLSAIDHVRLDTRWDFSVRATVRLKAGKPVRLPDESLPPHRVFEAELLARGIRVERHHFRVF
ncbi:hypothetical protein [Pukyongiella litopenaei]|uniref:Uncharacterized protein n=1 Tax=Pukyongiella litopenaei TaxID=2605946 RepID=A0A2S0MS08_9RHOB|nr:hypothetical protein [Pukyongiella litopenaei]AVO38664.1 hypothetical protein C6Y53_13820 [Pukyongiella litopenaei]